MSTKYNKGSEWRKWDLQIQTILDDSYKSIDEYYKDIKARNHEKWDILCNHLGSEQNVLKYDSKAYFFTDISDNEKTKADNYSKLFFKYLELFNNNQGAILLTDHNYEHRYLIDSLVKESILSNIKVIPGVEINVGGVHILVIFDKVPYEQRGYSDGIKMFLSKINVNNRKTNGVYTVCNKGYAEVYNEIKTFDGLFIYAHCNSTNGLFQERGRTDRTHLADQFNSTAVNIIQSQNKRSINSSIDYIKSSSNLTSSFIPTIASDSRSLQDIFSSDEDDNYCWIKSDPTFQGLKHAIIESNNRIFIGEIPEKLNVNSESKENLINSINISSTENKNEWFDAVGKIEFNEGLVAIIGNKGSGKSALADIISLAGNCHQNDFTFLNKNKFQALRIHKKYSAEINFQDGYTKTIEFTNNKPDYTKDARCIYLSQTFVNDLCDSTLGVEKLQSEINRVIFSHVPQEEKLFKDNLKDLIQIKTTEQEENRTDLIKQMEELNKRISSLEFLLSKQNKESINNKLAELQRRLKTIIDNEKPSVVDKPDDALLNRIGSITTRYNGIKFKIEEKIGKKQASLNTLNASIQHVHEIIAEINSFQKDYSKISRIISQSTFLKDAGINPDNIIKILIRTEKLDQLIKVSTEKVTSIRQYIEKSKVLLDHIDSYLHKISKKLTDKHAVYHKYTQSITIWKNKQKAITGDKKTKNTILYITSYLEELEDSVPQQLKELIIQRTKLSKEIVHVTFEKEKCLSSIYSYAQANADSFSKLFSIPINEFLKFDSRLSISQQFADEFFNFISQNKSGTFYKVDEGRVELDKIINEIDMLDEDSISKFPVLIINALHHNLATDPSRSDANCQTLIENQLSAKTKKEDFYNYLFSFEYINARFTFTYDSKTLNHLSPGEKGILLLIFYLLIDKNKQPIIIDQPEENLDNETVFLRLVSFIKYAKQKRQIIIVTHNPNLAVVSDAEQIIQCNLNKSMNNLITHQCGSIENLLIKDLVIRILEGTELAFLNRQFKYDLKGKRVKP